MGLRFSKRKPSVRRYVLLLQQYAVKYAGAETNIIKIEYYEDSVKVKSSKVCNCRDWSQRTPTFPAQALRQRKKRVLNKFLCSKHWNSLRNSLQLPTFELSTGDK